MEHTKECLAGGPCDCARKLVREYQRPNTAPGTTDTDQKRAWTIAWSLQCDIDYLLSETNSKPFQPPKHMLDMMLKHIHRELDDILRLIEEKPREADE